MSAPRCPICEVTMKCQSKLCGDCNRVISKVTCPRCGPYKITMPCSCQSDAGVYYGAAYVVEMVKEAVR